MSTPLFTITEGSNCGLYVECRDNNDDLFVPSSIVYSVHDEDTGTPLTSDIYFISTGSIFTITIPAVANAIIAPWKDLEVHVVTLTMEWDSNHFNKEIRYNVDNLKFV